MVVQEWEGEGVSNLCFVKTNNDASPVQSSLRPPQSGFPSKFPLPPHLPLREDRRVDHLFLSKLCSVWAPGLNIIYFIKVLQPCF